MTYTNKRTHEIIEENLHRAPMFTGIVKGVGARYCPSIEDKIVRFNDKPRHQLFLEPEGLENEEVYVQGFSTSLPEDVQLKMLHSIAGLEKAEMMRTGYAIEYDVVVPHQLRPTLETKKIANLFTAGQTNGTSGYEEAAGQGLIAGINAALKVQEPYRLLTSRAEYRLILRHDNADFRLTEMGHTIGLVKEEQYQAFLAKKEKVEAEIARLEHLRLKPTKEIQAFLATKEAAPLKDGVIAKEFLRRPEVSYLELCQFLPEGPSLTNKEIEQIEIQVKYEGYIKKALEKVEKLKRMEEKRIPENIDYDAINSLATEARQKLNKIRPETIAQASRISGVNPSDISILMVYIEQGKIAKVNVEES